MALAPHTRVLHLALIRLAKGMIDAWEKWLQACEEPAERSKSR